MSATLSSTSKKEGLEIVPFLKRPLFVSPPLMFCFKECSVTIPCGQCKQLVKSSTSNGKNSNNNSNGLFGHEDLLEQLSDHYRFNFWISERSHTEFFLHPELNRDAYCIVCRRSFPSIPRVIKHVREILLDPTMRTRKYHWLILENVTSLFVNRDIGFVESDEKLVKLLGKLFPEENHFFSWTLPSFEQIFESLRFIIDAPVGLNSDRSNPGINATENTEGISRDVQDGSTVSTPTSEGNLAMNEAIIPNGTSSFRSTDLEFDLDNGQQIQLVNVNSAAQVSSGQDDQGVLSQLTETMRNESDDDSNNNELQHSEDDYSAESDYITSNESETEQLVEEIDISFASHRQRVTRWVSMQPLVFPATSGTHSTPRNSCDDHDFSTIAETINSVNSQPNTLINNRSPRVTSNIIQNAFIRRRSCRTPHRLNIEHDPTIDLTVSESITSTCFDELNISSRTLSSCSVISGNVSKVGQSEDMTPVDENDTGFTADFSSLSNETYIVDKQVHSSRKSSRTTGSSSTFANKSSSPSSSVNCDQPMMKAKVVRVKKVSNFKQYASRSRSDTKCSHGSRSLSHHFSGKSFYFSYLKLGHFLVSIVQLMKKVSTRVEHFFHERR